MGKPNSEEIRNHLRRLFCEKLAMDPNSFHEDTGLTELGADSLDLVEVMLEVQEVYSVEIPDDASMHFRSLREAAEYIESLVLA